MQNNTNVSVEKLDVSEDNRGNKKGDNKYHQLNEEI
jgi:hypothetical protein